MVRSKMRGCVCCIIQFRDGNDAVCRFIFNDVIAITMTAYMLTIETTWTRFASAMPLAQSGIVSV